MISHAKECKCINEPVEYDLDKYLIFKENTKEYQNYQLPMLGQMTS
jgi:hypothetical protein